ncbi:glycyl-radical enzyme activating protein [Spirochaetia bacterium]|nr:glycyl-radical enzyme activating protein [Spirochaetia bacterium]
MSSPCGREDANTGVVFDIQRFSLQDGPGIRTTVFLKGCPLDCIWCHNPESGDPKPEIMYYPDTCIHCGECTAVCPEKRHRIGEEGHLFTRNGCIHCGACAAVCFSGALSLIGKSYTAAEVLAEVKQDEPFYRNSGGGMTLSGGEPFYQAAFALTLLSLAKQNGLHTCVETSGAAPFRVLRKALTVTDLFLFDVKETDPEKHREFTGSANTLLLDNLKRIDEAGAKTVLRCPIIPGCNDRDEHFRRLGALASGLRNVVRIDIEPYHPLGISKAAGIGKPERYTAATLPSKETTAVWAETVRKHTSVPVVLL